MGEHASAFFFVVAELAVVRRPSSLHPPPPPRARQVRAALKKIKKKKIRLVWDKSTNARRLWWCANCIILRLSPHDPRLVKCSSRCISHKRTGTPTPSYTPYLGRERAATGRCCMTGAGVSPSLSAPTSSFAFAMTDAMSTSTDLGSTAVRACSAAVTRACSLGASVSDSSASASASSSGGGESVSSSSGGCNPDGARAAISLNFSSRNSSRSFVMVRGTTPSRNSFSRKLHQSQRGGRNPRSASALVGSDAAHLVDE